MLDSKADRLFDCDASL